MFFPSDPRAAGEKGGEWGIRNSIVRHTCQNQVIGETASGTSPAPFPFVFGSFLFLNGIVFGAGDIDVAAISTGTLGFCPFLYF